MGSGSAFAAGDRKQDQAGQNQDHQHRDDERQHSYCSPYGPRLSLPGHPSRSGQPLRTNIGGTSGDEQIYAGSASRRRWLITAETPSPRMLTPYKASATSIVRFWWVITSSWLCARSSS
jgi:hypothetical protein